MDKIRLVSITQQNPALTPGSVGRFTDLPTLWQADTTFPEALVEYAGRVCYRSTERMGTAPDFTRLRVREGHTDILEHVWAVFEFSDEVRRPVTPYLRHVRHWDRTRIAGNLRAWMGDMHLYGTQRLLAAHMPRVLSAWVNVIAANEPAPTGVPPVSDGQMRVALLGYSLPPAHNDPALGDAQLWGHATFLIEGVSRALTHQLVRHRLGSFSQESQRYVDLEKGSWSAIVPPAIAADEQAARILHQFWTDAERAYSTLRSLDIRKEDARYLLPNAAETRLIMSMPFDGWTNFLDQRRAKAAQWEIRTLAEHIGRQLEALAPQAFGRDA